MSSMRTSIKTTRALTVAILLLPGTAGLVQAQTVGPPTDAESRSWLLQQPLTYDWRASARARPECSDLQRATYWIEELRPLFTGTDPAHSSFRKKADLATVDPDTSASGVVTDAATCAAIATAVEGVLGDIEYWQNQSYDLMMTRFGPYYVVAVDEQADQGRTLVLVLDATTYEIPLRDMLI